MSPIRALALAALFTPADCEPPPPTPAGTQLEGFVFEPTSRPDLEDPTFEGQAEERVVRRSVAEAAVVEFRIRHRVLRYRFEGVERRARIPESVVMTVVSSRRAVSGSCYRGLLGYAGPGGQLHVSCGVERAGVGGGLSPTHVGYPGDIVFVVADGLLDHEPQTVREPSASPPR